MRRNTTKPVTEIRQPALEEAPRPRYRWIVPAVNGPAYAHVQVVGAPFVLCKAAHAEGGIYPPAADVPKCADCKRELAREEEGAPDDA